MGKRSAWALPYFIFLVFFVVLPLVLIAFYALTDAQGHFTLANMAAFFKEPKIINSFIVSIEVALENTLICIAIGYPVAYILADSSLNKSAVTALLFILPMWINALMRTIATAEIFHALGIGLRQVVAARHRDAVHVVVSPRRNQPGGDSHQDDQQEQDGVGRGHVE